MAATFKAGSTYTFRSAGDADFVGHFTVISRTEKTVRTAYGTTLRIKLWNGIETVLPWGNYSMAPVVFADRPVQS
jgi:hypothetical protein